MGLKLYNTLTRTKEEFQPLEKGKVGMYVCGITAYDVSHVGHARSAVVFDIIYRYLTYRGYDVTFVKNYTDVDDKIIAKAEKEGCNISEIAERFIGAYDDDMRRLGIARPTAAPRATEHIERMIRLVDTLIEKGFAYAAGGDVYFSVNAFPGYGKLSGRNLDDMMAGARVEIGEKKKNPLDFALWKASKPGEPWWESPWGPGRPGWHIECSAMSQRYLGETFDIHGGGEDLIFPHHENEIAQSEGATGKPFARFWIHNGFIRVNSEKMSKSLGNISTIREILDRYDSEVLRLFLLQSHYRSFIDFSDEGLTDARAAMDRCYATLGRIKEALVKHSHKGSAFTEKNLRGADEEMWSKANALPERFVEAMDDDFNTARAMGHIFDLVRVVNTYLDSAGATPGAETLFVLDAAKKAIRETGGVLGLFLEDPDTYFEEDKKREARKRGLDIDEIERLIAERREARAAKRWKRADEIRDYLAGKGVVLKDTPAATTWKIQ